MYSVSSLFKKYITQSDRQFEIKALVVNITYDNTKVIDIEIDDSLILSEEFTIGTVVSSHMTISIRTSDVIASNAKIIPYVRLNGIDGYSEWIKLGEFYVDTRNYQNGVSIFSCYDILILSQQPYVSALTFPTSMQAVFNEICTLLGVTIDSSVVINPSYMINTKPIGYNMHDILSYMSMAHASSIQITKNGALGFIKFSMGLFRTPINTSQYITAEQTNPTKTYTKFICTYSAKGDTYTAGSGTADQTLNLNNPFIDQNILNNICTALSGFSYTPYTMNWTGCIYLEVGDLIQINLRDGSVINSAILTNKAYIKGGLRVESAAPSLSPQRSEFDFKGGFQEVSDPQITDISIQDSSISIAYDDNSVSTYNLTKDGQGRVTALGKGDGTSMTIHYTDTLVNPLFLSAAVTTDGNSVVVTFDHVMINPTGHQNEFTIKINSVKATILSTSQGNYSTKVSLNIFETIKTTDVVTVSYS